MPKVTPFLWFDTQAEEAAKFYTSIFKNSKMGGVARYGDDMPGKAGSVLTASFEIEGVEYTALNGGPNHNFTDAISFVVHCETQEEVDYYWSRLLEGGTPQQCGWLTDRFGVSWQVLPTILPQMLREGDAVKADRVMKALLPMVKFDIAALRRAYEEE